MILGGLAFVATLAFEIPFAKLEALLIGGKRPQQNRTILSTNKVDYYKV